MKRLLAAALVSIALAVPLTVFAQNQRVIAVDSSNTEIPKATTTEAQHDTALGTITAVKALLDMGRASAAVPSAVSADDDAVLGWNNRSGSRAVFLTANAVGGCTPGKLVSAASTNATSITSVASQVYTFTASNTNAAVRYLKIYDKSSAPTVGTDVPKQTIALPPNGAAPPQLGTAVGMSFANGIAFALTTGAADSDTNAVAANEILVNYCIK